MKIAIIGSGIAGLAATHHLIPHHLAGRIELTVFERAPRTGGHANTVEAESERGVERIDTGFIVFNSRNYPLFSSMLEELEVPSRPSEMSFSASDGESFEYTGRNLSGLFADRRNLLRPRFLRMLAEVPRLQRRLRQMVSSDDEITLDEFVRREKVSDDVREKVLVPMVSAVWSADEEAMTRFPVAFLARFLDNHGLLELADRPRWRTVEGGSRAYVDRLLAPVSGRVRLRSGIEMVRRLPNGVAVKPDGQPAELFDQVIVATHAPETLTMLADPDPEERRFLAKFRYRTNQALLHDDPSVMPRRPAAWASWNYRLGAGGHGLTALTYDMNRLQGLACQRRFFVSLNLSELIDPARVIGSFTYEHPVFTPESVAAQSDWGSVSGRGGVHFAGAWLRNGFHEDGAVTGRRAAEAALAASTTGPGLAVAA